MSKCDISVNSTLRDAVKIIEDVRKTIAVIVDNKGKIKGTISDGDIRRALLSGFSLEDKVTVAMNQNPVFSKDGMPSSYYIELININKLEALPLVNDEEIFQKVVHASELNDFTTYNDVEGCTAVIMAGGEGKRLLPITKKIPKPMVKIGGIPLIELQVKQLSRIGIKKIFISVNYLSQIIEDHLGDGSKYEVEIRYLREQKKLGTAGALSLFPDKPDGPIIVMNGDVLTKSNYANFLNFHKKYDAKITVAAVEYNIQIPYGVISSIGPRITSLEEKPSQRFLCNAGLYALSPEVLSSIPSNTLFNITDLIEIYLEEESVNVFPIHEYWADIGTPYDLENARNYLDNNCDI